jgi:hypothetical protein
MITEDEAHELQAAIGAALRGDNTMLTRAAAIAATLTDSIGAWHWESRIHHRRRPIEKATSAAVGDWGAPRGRDADGGLPRPSNSGGGPFLWPEWNPQN